jgi:hypothetical protein
LTQDDESIEASTHKVDDDLIPTSETAARSRRAVTQLVAPDQLRRPQSQRQSQRALWLLPLGPWRKTIN